MNDLYIIKNGACDYSIVVPDDASAVEENAARELRDYLIKATNLHLSIRIESKAEGKCIYVGHTDFAKNNAIIGAAEENWQMAVCGDNLVLTGGLTKKQRGITYAVYHFLEDIVGIRWWNHVEEYVPQIKELKIEKDFKKEGTPLFKMRKIVNTFGTPDFYPLAHAKVNMVGAGDNVIGRGHSRSVIDTGGAYCPGPPAQAHTMELFFPAEEYFEEHPDWWGWDEAEQRRKSNRQHCMSSEGLYQALEEKLLDIIRAEYSSAKNYGIEIPHFFSVSVSDNQFHCECPACKASVQKSGRMGHILKFVNRLARTVAKEYPEALLETFAYWDYIDPPIDDTVPEKNVLIRVADMLVDVVHDINYPTNSKKLDMLKKWTEICKKSGSPIYTWEYIIHDFVNYPIAYMYQLPGNYRKYYELGVTGCFTENELGFLSDFWPCTEWMLSKYLENPYIDFEETLNDFLTKYYGEKSAPYLHEFLELVHKVNEESDCRVLFFQNTSNWNYTTPELIAEGLRLFELAHKAAEGNSIYEQRIREAEVTIYKCIAVRRSDFVRLMKLSGKEFALPSVKEASAKVLACLEEIKAKYEFHIRDTSMHCDKWLLRAINKEIPVFEQLLEEGDAKDAPLPDILDGVSADDVYQIPAYRIQRSATYWYISQVKDEKSASGTVLSFKAAGVGFTDELVDSSEWRLPLILETDNKPNREILISQAELADGEYHWFRLENVDDVCRGSNSCLYVRVREGLAIKLNFLQECFPFNSCDIYVAVRGEGHSFGGNKDKEDAIIFDRFLIVKRS